jgi:hypothetical protein
MGHDMDDDRGAAFRRQIHRLKRLVTWPRYRKGMDDQTSSSIADEIIKHLKLSNWRFRRGQPTPPHSTPGPRREL